MNRSLMERLVDDLRYQDASRMLGVQYRMHPDIAAWPNRPFYKNQLQDCESLQHVGSIRGFMWPNNSRIAFVNVESPDATGLGGPSKVNYGERDAVKEICVAILHGGSVAGKDVGIVSPCRAQIDLLRRAIHDVASDVRIETVDKFQGQE